MKLEKQLDKILEILYDEKNLIFKRVPTIDIAVFGKQKYGLDWTESEVLFIIDILIDEGYIIQNKGDFSGNNVKMPTYSLTTKGIRLKQNGGFVRKLRIEWLTQFLIISASIVTILIGIVTFIDLYNKYSPTPTEITNQTENENTVNDPTQKSHNNIEINNNEQTNSDNNPNNNSNNNKMNTVFNSETITDSIQKPCIRTTKK